MRKLFLPRAKDQKDSIYQKLPQPSKEAHNECRLLIKGLKEKLHQVGPDNIRRDKRQCSPE